MRPAGLILPPRLRRGDRVALVAPASPAGPERWHRAKRALELLGYQVELGVQRDAMPSGYTAGTAKDRAEELNRLFQDDRIRGIWCLRGGYTGAGLLPLLDYESIARHPKVFVGYSDVTCLHTALNQRCGFVTYHGPMAATDLAEQPRSDTLACLQAVLAGEPCFVNPGGGGIACVRPGEAVGVLTGGNLTIIASRMGTPWALKPEGKILFLEDIDEPVPVLERMLNQLADTGVLARVSGVLLGSFEGCINPYQKGYGPLELFCDFFHDYPKPVLSGLQCGHCCPNGTLPLGQVCWVDGQRGQIRFEL